MLSRARRATVVFAGSVVLVTGLVACGDDEPSDPGNQRSVTVVGNGQVEGAPDTLRADLGVETAGDDVSTAVNAANQEIAAITEAVVNAGVPRENIQTQQVTLSPDYSNPVPGGSSQISGYRATNSLRVDITDLTKASNVLEVAVEAGGNSTRISNVSFVIDDDSDLVVNAREKAFSDARDRADQYARLSGDELGKVLTIDETSSGQQVQAGERTAMESSAVPLEPGQQTVSFSVTVKWQLK
ncbi:SIMPL domain-containing protein [Williamsia soli]|uniref:SIMPL domain-containing protein n=1 Tax=Williamsia soli TaxID=364929 RepID=UPI001A9FC424|nr:SIMPL domain-containing protein [Williamsia soli]